MPLYTRTELATLLGDNTAGALQPVHIRAILENFLLVFINWGISNSSTPFPTFTGAWQLASGLNGVGEKSNFADPATGEVTIPVAGRYQLGYDVNLSAANASGGDIEIGIFRNPTGTPAEIKVLRTEIPVGAKRAAKIPLVVSFATDDKIGVAFKGPTGEQVIVEDATLTLERID